MPKRGAIVKIDNELEGVYLGRYGKDQYAIEISRCVVNVAADRITFTGKNINSTVSDLSHLLDNRAFDLKKYWVYQKACEKWLKKEGLK